MEREAGLREGGRGELSGVGFLAGKRRRATGSQVDGVQVRVQLKGSNLAAAAFSRESEQKPGYAAIIKIDVLEWWEFLNGKPKDSLAKKT
jgi:hypothetical protein